MVTLTRSELCLNLGVLCSLSRNVCLTSCLSLARCCSSVASHSRWNPSSRLHKLIHLLSLLIGQNERPRKLLFLTWNIYPRFTASWCVFPRKFRKSVLAVFLYTQYRKVFLSHSIKVPCYWKNIDVAGDFPLCNIRDGNSHVKWHQTSLNFHFIACNCLQRYFP